MCILRQKNATKIYFKICQCKLLSVKTEQTYILVWEYSLSLVCENGEKIQNVELTVKKNLIEETL